MRPIKNKIFCTDCGRSKMLFETEKKALNFIKFNNEEITDESGFCPQRAYYCLFCDGWHTTSIKVDIGISKKEKLFEQYQQEKNNKCKAIINQNSINKNEKTDKLIEYNRYWESRINDIEQTEKESFFIENISTINNEIKLLLHNSDSCKEKLKELRQNLEILSIIRKKHGFQRNNIIAEGSREKQIEEWRSWAIKIGYQSGI